MLKTFFFLFVAAAHAGPTKIDLTKSVTGVLPYANGGTNTNNSFSQNSVIFGGASSFAEDNANFTYNDATGLLTLNNGIGAGTTGLKVYRSNEQHLQLVDSSNVNWSIGGQSGTFYIEKNGFNFITFNAYGLQFNGAAGTPRWQFNNLVADNSTSVGDIIPNSATHNLSIIVGQNSDATANNYSGWVTSGGTPGSTSATSPDTAILGVHEVHTVGSESAHLEFYTENGGAGLVKGLTITKDAIIQLPVQGGGSTPTCAAGGDSGKLALTSAFILCVCNGSAWKKAADGSTACTF